MDSPPLDRPAKSDSTFLAKLRYWLLEPTVTKFDRRTIFWFLLSLALSAVMAYGPLKQAFSGPYVLQDDSRQHIFWMERFADPELFQNDFVTDYLQAVAPWGYKAFYYAFARLGVDPLLLSKLLPIVMGLLATAACFAVSMTLLRVPSSAFVSATLLGEALWASDNIVSSTPRAFMYPLLFLFLLGMMRRSLILSLASIALLCLFYPPIVPVPLGVIVLGLVSCDSKRIRFSRERLDYALCAAALGIAGLVLIPYALQIAQFGPVVTAPEARLMPEFLPGGRMVVFREGFVNYWLTGKHTGMFASSPLRPLGLSIGLALPFLWLPRWRMQLTAVISPGIRILPRFILSSIVMFFAAHALLFRLYLPSRFTVHSFRIVLALCAGLAATLMLSALFRRIDTGSRAQLASALVSACLVLYAAVVALPLVGGLSREKYKTGQYSRLYDYLATQSKTAVIASLSREVDDLPVFARRSILVGREIALPFHKTYYDEIRRRASDLIAAQYSPDLAELKRFLKAYDVKFLLVNRQAFRSDRLSRDKWLMQFEPAVRQAIDNLNDGKVPALSRVLDQGAVLRTGDLILLDAERIDEIPSPSEIDH
jgi:hypothetical protein